MKNVAIIYQCIWKKAKDKSYRNKISVKEMLYLLQNVYGVPKNLRYPILKEMENLKLFKKVSWDQVEVLDCGIDLKNTSAIYKKVGLFGLF